MAASVSYASSPKAATCKTRYRRDARSFYIRVSYRVRDVSVVQCDANLRRGGRQSQVQRRPRAQEVGDGSGRGRERL